jgi:hypothetical protein
MDILSRTSIQDDYQWMESIERLGVAAYSATHGIPKSLSLFSRHFFSTYVGKYSSPLDTVPVVNDALNALIASMIPNKCT